MSQIWPLGAFKLTSCVLLTSPCHFFGALLQKVYLFFPSPAISYFSEEPLFLLLKNGV